MSELNGQATPKYTVLLAAAHTLTQPFLISLADLAGLPGGVTSRGTTKIANDEQQARV